MSTVSIYRDSESSPAVTLYGDDGDHEMILRYLDGWYGTPESKVQLAERSNGNGSHDIATADIDYGARTIGIDWRIIAADRNRLLELLHAIRSLAGHTVRVRVVDGMDDLYAVGYVYEAPKDKSSQNILRQTETGSLTIICPRPELLSWSSRGGQLTPATTTGGGLSFGVPDYVKSWTGTANASASTMSQDGAVVATNSCTDPNALQRIGTWSPAGSTTAVQRPDGHWVYTPSSDVTKLAISIPIGSLTQDDYVYCEWLGGMGNGGLENMDTVAKGNGWILGKNTNPTGNKTLWPKLNGTPITILKVGRYSAADYAAMQALGVNWFDGDTQSPQPNTGLVFPLSFGVTASPGNILTMVNMGSSTAYPTLTFTGGFPDGVTLVHDQGTLSYGQPVGATPVVVDTRAGTASLGGSDVSRNLTSRVMPRIPAGGSLTLRLLSSGSGWVTVTSHDTYI